MGLCIGGKWCRRQECRKRCDGWFGTMGEIRDACRSACHNSTSFTKEEFLCSGDYIDQEYVIGRYKYDPCKDDDITLPGFLDPLNERERQEEQRQDMLPVYAGLGLLFFAALIVITIGR